jgi:hypothetical protein
MQDVRSRLEAFAAGRYAGMSTRLAIHFHGQFCYVDAFTEPDHVGPPLGGETREEAYG